MRELLLESFDSSDVLLQGVETDSSLSRKEVLFLESLTEYCQQTEISLSDFLLYSGKEEQVKSVFPYFNFKGIVSSELLNRKKYVNKYLEGINEMLETGQQLIIGAETSESLYRKNKLKYGKYLGFVVSSIHFLTHRVCPKICALRKFYYRLNNNPCRSLSMVEILGRLVSCGFKIESVTHENGFDFFKVMKIKEPVFDLSPSYAPVFSMKRVGQYGQIIKVFKFRTMHAYSEYLQTYIYENNKLDANGKFKYDYRVSTIGRFMRKYWIDELPMLMNLFTGDLRLIGVRPISKQYLDLYPEELKKKRFFHKPGVLPPYYADNPKSFNEIVESEMRYLIAKEKDPFMTDVKYFFKIMYNIIIRRRRSA